MKDAEATGLYGWIQSNDGKSAILFAIFMFSIQMISTLLLFIPLMLFDPGHAPFFNWGGYFTRYAPLVLIGSILWFAWKMFWHIEAVKRAVGFEFVDAQDEPRLCRIIEPLITISGLPVPFVGVIEDEARNAFACGIGRKKAVIVVTRGLLDSLDDEELANVLGHELSHIKHGDIRLMAAANIFLGGLSSVHKNNPLRFTPIHLALAIAIPVILPLSLAGGLIGHFALRIGQVTRLILSSSREFIADAEAVQLTKNPAALASALLKVESNYRVGSARDEDDAMMIAGDADGAYATHPTVAQRIAALARTTGSMVFNAPGAPNEQMQTSFSFEQARSAALLQSLPPARLLARIRADSSENFLGLSNSATVMVLLTIGSLLWIHSASLNRPSELLAKFDMRQLSAIVGAPSACQLSLFSQEAAKNCKTYYNDAIYANFEGQDNTLAGWLAERGRQRKKEKEAQAD